MLARVAIACAVAALAACGGATPSPATPAKRAVVHAPAAPEKSDEAKCDEGDGAACYMAGIDAEHEKKDDAAARAFYEKSCALDNGDGCGSVAVSEPLGPRRKMLEEKACDEGHASACFNLGTEAAQDGDDRHALRYLRKACSAGDAFASGPACELADTLRARLAAARTETPPPDGN